MRKFYLKRDIDETGISGTGTVARGVIFDNGKCCMCWETATSSIALYDCLEDVKTIHGHNGKTKVIREVQYDDSWDGQPYFLYEEL